MNEEEEKHEIDQSAVAVAEPPENEAAHESETDAAHESEAEAVHEPVAEESGAGGEPPPTAPPVSGEGEIPAQPASTKNWYVVKVQSGREESIKNALVRRVKVEELEEYVGRILIPTEKVTELRNGKRVVKKRKKFPGYLMCEVEFNDKVLYLFRETSGVGDFVGGSLTKKPAPMNPREVERMLLDEDDKGGEKTPGAGTSTGPKIIIPYAVNDRVRVRDGTFKDMEGEVKEITQPADPKENPKVKVVLTIWGRPVDVDVEYWQVDPV